MQILVLQEIGVAPIVFRRMLRRAGIELEPVWGNWRQHAHPEHVEILVTVDTPVNAKVLRRLSNVRAVAVAFTGYDAVDIKACRDRHVTVYNVPSYAVTAVAELTIGLAIALLRHISSVDRQMHIGTWVASEPGVELRDKVVGIVGTGRIGMKVARLFRAFGCNVIGWSRTQRPAFRRFGGRYMRTLPALLGDADIVSVHVPLNSRTRGLIGARELAVMKPGACLINVARGPILDRKALVRVLRKGHVRAALDVFDPEPLAKSDPLRKLGHRVVLTPHIGYDTREALEKRAEVTVENIRAYLCRSNRNRVDLK